MGKNPLAYSVLHMKDVLWPVLGEGCYPVIQLGEKKKVAKER